MTTQQWVNNAIKTLIALIIAIVCLFAVDGIIANLNETLQIIMNLIVFVGVLYLLLPKDVKNGIKNW